MTETGSLERPETQRGFETAQTVLDKLDRLFDAASPEAVFAAPVSAEGRTVITAAEVLVWAGAGGGGGGTSQPTAETPAAETVEATEERAASGPNEGYGIGVGGGGSTLARPVAVIIMDSQGVRVEPIVDVTKVALAALTALGSMFFMLLRMQRK